MLLILPLIPHSKEPARSARRGARLAKVAAIMIGAAARTDFERQDGAVTGLTFPRRYCVLQKRNSYGFMFFGL